MKRRNGLGGMQKQFRGFYTHSQAVHENERTYLLSELENVASNEWKDERRHIDCDGFNFFELKKSKRKELYDTCLRIMLRCITHGPYKYDNKPRGVFVNRFTPPLKKTKNRFDGGLKLHVDGNRRAHMITVAFVLGTFSGGVLKVAKTKNGAAQIVHETRNIPNYRDIAKLNLCEGMLYWFPGCLVDHAVSAVSSGTRYAFVAFFPAKDSLACLWKLWNGKQFQCQHHGCSFASHSKDGLRKHLQRNHNTHTAT